MIQNKKYSKEEYEKKVAKLKAQHSGEDLFVMLEEIKKDRFRICNYTL